MGAVVLLTVLVDVPAELGADLAQPAQCLLVATVFNTLRLLALGVTIGLVARGRATREELPPTVTRRKAQS